jgi:hypothetical protein
MLLSAGAQAEALIDAEVLSCSGVDRRRHVVNLPQITSFRDGGPYDKFVFVKNPDGNNWAVQEVPATRPAFAVADHQCAGDVAR